jgi:hypothetical protein
MKKCMNSSINRALIFQGGGSLGAYEAGAYKAIKEELSQYRRAKGRENGVIFLTMRTISSHLSVFLVDGIITSVLAATETSLSGGSAICSRILYRTRRRSL